jgi:hypothetical protein
MKQISFVVECDRAMLLTKVIQFAVGGLKSESLAKTANSAHRFVVSLSSRYAAVLIFAKSGVQQT